MANYVLNSAETENGEFLFTKGAVSVDTLPKNNYLTLVNQGLASIDEDNTISLTDEGQAYFKEKAKREKEEREAEAKAKAEAKVEKEREEKQKEEANAEDAQNPTPEGNQEQSAKEPKEEPKQEETKEEEPKPEEQKPEEEEAPEAEDNTEDDKVADDDYSKGVDDNNEAEGKPATESDHTFVDDVADGMDDTFVIYDNQEHTPLNENGMDDESYRKEMSIVTEALSFRCSNIVAQEGVSDIITGIMPVVTNGFKSFLNLITPDKFVGFSMGFSAKDFSANLGSLPYMTFGQMNMPVPQGLKVKYLTYIDALESAVARAIEVPQIVDSFTNFVGNALTNHDSLKDTTPTTIYTQMKTSRDSIYATVGACFDKSNKATAKYSKLVDRNGDWEEIINRSTAISDKLNQVNREALLKQGKHLHSLLTKVNDMAKRGGFDLASPEAVKNIGEGAYQVACEMEFYSVIYYRVQVLVTVLGQCKEVIAKTRKLEK